MPDRSQLLHHVLLPQPELPAELQGLRIVHLSDLHIRRPRRRHDTMIKLLAELKCDLVVLTGDYIWGLGHDDATVLVMQRLVDSLSPRLGTFGVFGNHDTPELQDRLRDMPVHWLDNATLHLPGLPVEIMGVSIDTWREPDCIALINSRYDAASDGITLGEAGRPPLSILLCHYPWYLPMAADLGVDLMFAGHTHGGQLRLPIGGALYNSSDLPLRLTSGILRHRDTLCGVSRGLGEIGIALRLFCPPHLPVYTLTRAPLPGQHCSHIENVQPW